ncbi:zinc finger, CCHC-type containing protein [Tanacetum coccineum]
MHFSLTTLKVVYVLTTPMLELMEDDTVEALKRTAKWKNNDYICRGHILNGMSDSLFDVYQNVESDKKLWDSLESKYMAEDASSKKFLSISVSSVINKLPPSWKDFKHTLKHGKDDLSLVQLGSHLCIEDSLRAQDSDKGRVDVIAWWIDSGATTHVCKDRCWFNTYEPVEEGFVLYMGDDHFAPVHGKGSVTLEFSFGKTITWFNVLYVPKLRKNLVSGPMLNKCGYKQVYDSDNYILSKSGVFVGFGYYNNGIIHETTALYTPQQNGMAERKNKAFKEMVNIMLSYSCLSEGFWGEAMLMACYLLNRVPNKRNKNTLYQLCIEQDPRTYDEDMQSWDAAFWKEAIDDEIGSIMENNT